MIKYVLLLIQIVGFQIIFAQKIFNSGVVELQTGEKIEALILQDSYKNYARTVSYKGLKGGTLEVKSPYEIQSFSINKQNIKFQSFEVTDRYLIAPNVYSYRKIKVFMKQLEEGEINLYEFKDDEGNLWLYLQKKNESLQRLEAVKKEYSGANKGEMIRIDTVASTKHIRGGFFKTEKPYLKILSESLKDCEAIRMNGSFLLQRKSVLDIVRDYNKCQNNAQSYFTGRTELRLYVLGNRHPVDNRRSSQLNLSSISGEIELLSNRINNNISFSVGFLGGGRIELDKSAGEREMTIRQTYLRSNFYISQRNRLKPFVHAGFKLFNTKIIGVSDSKSTEGFLSIGGGLLYEIADYGIVRLEVGTLPFPDFKLGLGMRLY